MEYNGICPICGSQDGTIVRGTDGKYRNICRVMGCPAMYIPAPYIGFDKFEDCQNPFGTDLIADGITIEEYIGKNNI